MDFRADPKKVGPYSFPIVTIFLPGGYAVTLLQSFQKSEGYSEMTEQDRKIAESKLGYKWPTIVDSAIKEIRGKVALTKKKILKVDDDEWDELVLAAEEHRSANYRRADIPTEIADYSEKTGLAPKKASQAILKEASQIDHKADKFVSDTFALIRKLRRAKDDTARLSVYKDILRFIENAV